jgi:hypothetical protein
VKVGNVSDVPASSCEVERRRYVYCVIHADRPLTFATPGVAGPECPVYTINYQNLAAVVSSSPEVSYDGTRRNLTSHMRVLEEVMRERPILPIRFNSVSPSVEEVVRCVLAPGMKSLPHSSIALRGTSKWG